MRMYVAGCLDSDAQLFIAWLEKKGIPVVSWKNEDYTDDAAMNMIPEDIELVWSYLRDPIQLAALKVICYKRGKICVDLTEDLVRNVIEVQVL